MMSSHQLISRTLVGVVACLGMLLAIPAEGGSAVSLSSGRQPLPPEVPPGGEPLLPTLTLFPVDGSAKTQVEVLGSRLANCLAVHGDIEASRNGVVSALAAGDMSLYWDGLELIPITQLDEKLEFVASLEAAGSGVPGAQRVVSRCANVAEGTDFPEVAVPPSVAVPPAAEVVAAAPSTSPVEVTSTSPNPPPSAVLSEPPAAPAVTPPDLSDDSSAAQTQTPPAQNPPKITVAQPSLASATPTSWGLLTSLLILLGAVLGIPSLLPSALQARRGEKWVRTNVRVVSGTAPAIGTELTPTLGDYWPPTFAVRFDMHADRGNQEISEE